jgi:toxin ParE1/3/4
MAEIVWTERAATSLKEVYDYIVGDNPTAAMRTVEAIQEKVEVLAKFPELGYRYEGASGHDVRILLFGHYRIAYVLSCDKTIVIVGVFHAALDIERYLF